MAMTQRNTESHSHRPDHDAAIVASLYSSRIPTVVAGGLYDVNPFGQPGVETCKNATTHSWGRKGI